MDLLEANFGIVKARNCPMYKTGDSFALLGLSLYPPEGKPACLFLAKGLADILLQYLDKASSGGKLEKEYNCPGCTGIIKFGPIDSSNPEFLTPHMQMLAAAEVKEKSLQSESLLEMLSTFSFFQAMEKGHLKEIIDRLQQKLYSSGQVIVQKGKPGKFLYIILSGSVSVLDDDGVTLATLQRGEIFGEMSLFSGKPASATIRANDAVRVLLLSGKDLSNILVKYPFLQMAFTRMLVQRLSSANAAKAEEYEAGVAGKLDEVSPSELFQMFNENAKTGIFELRLPLGPAMVTFSEGEVVRAEYAGKQGKEAFWAILAEHQGSFKFTSCLSLEDMGGEPLGSFIGLLMEGMRLMDEAKASTEQLAEK